MSSFSIWLLLEKESRSNYRQIVKTISKRLKAPIFEPHCTIYGHLNTDIEILKPFFILITVKILVLDKFKNSNIKYILSFLLLCSVIIFLT